MEKGKFDNLLKESLIKASEDIKMSPELKDRIIGKTTKERNSILKKLPNLLNTTIEIPISSAAIACVVLLVFIFSGFAWVWGGRYSDRSLQGYTSIKVIKMGPSDVIIDSSNKEVALYGVEDKN